MKIVVFTCDKYAFCVPIFYHYWKKNWPDCPYPLVIVAGEQKIDLPDDPNVSIIYQGADRGYASNAKHFFREFPDEMCLLMQEDFIIHEVRPQMVLRAERLCRKPEVGCVRLMPFPGPDRPLTELDSEGFGEIDKVTATWVFSMQAAIWKTKVFNELLREGDSPWQAEHGGTPRARRRQERFLCAEKAVIDYKQYCTIGEVIPSEVQWVKDHWDDPPARGPSGGPIMSPDSITVHLMIRDEEFWIGYILATLTKYMPNVFVFDTGSTDSTIQIVKSFPMVTLVEKGELNPHELCECRNEMMEMSQTPWVLQVDGDEFYPESSIEALLKCEMPVGKKVGFVRFLDVGWDGENFRAYEPFSRVAILAQEARFYDNVASRGYPFETPNLFHDKSLFHYFPDSITGYHLHHLSRSSRDEEVYLREGKKNQFSMQNREIPFREVLKIPFGKLRWTNPYLERA